MNKAERLEILQTVNVEHRDEIERLTVQVDDQSNQLEVMVEQNRELCEIATNFIIKYADVRAELYLLKGQLDD